MTEPLVLSVAAAAAFLVGFTFGYHHGSSRRHGFSRRHSFANVSISRRFHMRI